MDIITKIKKIHKDSRGFTILYAILIMTIVLTIGLSLLEVLIQQVSLSGVGRESALSFYVADSGMECGFFWDRVGATNTRSNTCGGTTCSLSWGGGSGDSLRKGNPIACDGRPTPVTASTVPISSNSQTTSTGDARNGSRTDTATVITKETYTFSPTFLDGCAKAFVEKMIQTVTVVTTTWFTESHPIWGTCSGVDAMGNPISFACIVGSYEETHTSYSTTITETVTNTDIQSRGYNTTCPPAASLKQWRLERGFQTSY